MKSMLPDVVEKNQQLETVEPTDLLTAIAKAAANPAVSVDKMERLFAMHQQIVKDNARVAFADALNKLQAELPQMEKHGKAKNSRFAKLEDIDTIVRPFLAKAGFSFSFDEEAHTEKTITFIATLTHKDGHSEAKRLTVPIDVASKNREGVSIRPAIQDAGSTVSYARRYLIKMHLNIIEKDEDTDGESLTPITEDQVRDLEIQLKDTKSDVAGFLRFMGYDKLSDIRVKDLKKAQMAIDEKKRSRK